MRTVKDIASARISETSDERFNSILKLLNGESIGRASFPRRAAKLKRRISGHGCVVLKEAIGGGGSGGGGGGGSNRK